MTYIKKLDDFVNEAIRPFAPWLDGKDEEEKNHRKYAHKAMTAAKRKADLERIKVLFDHNGKINPSDFGGIHDVLKDINWYIGAMYEPIKDHIKTNPDLGEKFFNMAVNIDRIYGGGKVQDAAICSFHKKIVQDKLYMFEPWNKGKSEIAQVFRMYLNFIEDKYNIVAESRSYRRGRRINEMIVNDGTMFTPKTEVELVGIVKNLYPERGLDGDYSDIDISGIRDAGIVKELAKNGKLDENAIGVLYLLGLSDEKDIEDKVFAPYSFTIDIKEKYPDGSGFEVDGELEAGISCNDDEDVIYIQYEGGLYFKYKAFWDDIYRRDDYDLEQYMSDEIKKPEIRLDAWSHNTYSIEKFPINAILGKYMCEMFERYVDKKDSFTDYLIGELYPPVEDDREPYDD